jgi:hypothetical protein
MSVFPRRCRRLTQRWRKITLPCQAVFQFQNIAAGQEFRRWKLDEIRWKYFRVSYVDLFDPLVTGFSRAASSTPSNARVTSLQENRERTSASAAALRC